MMAWAKRAVNYGFRKERLNSLPSQEVEFLGSEVDPIFRTTGGSALDSSPVYNIEVYGEHVSPGQRPNGVELV